MGKVDVIEFITTIRESFSGSITVYTMGNCYQFYEILKVVFPGAEPFESGGHVITKINGKFYDIRGEKDMTIIKAIPVKDDRIELFTKNKWSDERRKEYAKECAEKMWKNTKKRDNVVTIDENGDINIKEDKYDNKGR